ncbi:SDR family NAD(P)-dependent oxidoreductase [Mycobacterium sp. 4D054]|uniref:SDR family NAD(P)-dependent oxidoreductase n=1 Tax=Mycobacterium sp. 4D054 TaxID=3457440 RepID=UPI003FD6055D
MGTQQRVLVTGVDTELGAAVRDHFRAGGARTVGTCSAAPATASGETISVVADPADGAAVRAAVAAAAEAMGGIDTLVTAHGLPHVATVAAQSMDDFWAHVDSTLTGSFLFAQAAAERMRDTGAGGRMVLTTSRWHIGAPGLSAVATAAGGLVALTKSLTRDFGRFGVGVNAVAVGAVASEWSVCDAADGTPAAVPPIGRRGTVAEVARTIGLLCQRELGAAVGQVVNVDGGLSRNRV